MTVRQSLRDAVLSLISQSQTAKPRPHLLTRPAVRDAEQGCAVNETILTDAANQMHALGLGPAGYLYVNTDDCEAQAALSQRRSCSARRRHV
eukprot:SAG11_NODE_294_length_11142_cov_7.050439_9_plen_92_part_00